MNRFRRWIYYSAVASCLPLSSCKKMPAEKEQDDEQTAAKVVHQEQKYPDQPTRITLTEDARKRIDVHTAPIQEIDIGGLKQKVMPFSALLIDPEGESWAFTNSEPLTYVRQRIKVERIDGDKAILAQGPSIGTPVVTVGAALLYGSEKEFTEE
jgi:hypothetical protein